MGFITKAAISPLSGSVMSSMCCADDDDHRDRPGGHVVLQAVKHNQPRHVRQVQVQQDQVRLVLGGEGQPVLTGARGDHLSGPRRKQGPDDVEAVSAIVYIENRLHPADLPIGGSVHPQMLGPTGGSAHPAAGGQGGMRGPPIGGCRAGSGRSGSYDTCRSQPSQRMHRAACWNGTPVGRSQSVSHAVQCDGRLSVAGRVACAAKRSVRTRWGCIVLASQKRVRSLLLFGPNGGPLIPPSAGGRGGSAHPPPGPAKSDYAAARSAAAATTSATSVARSASVLPGCRMHARMVSRPS